MKAFFRLLSFALIFTMLFGTVACTMEPLMTDDDSENNTDSDTVASESNTTATIETLDVTDLGTEDCETLTDTQTPSKEPSDMENDFESWVDSESLDFTESYEDLTESQSETQTETEKATNPPIQTYTIQGYILSASDTADTYGNGMSMVYKLSDGSLMVFDGGNASVKYFLLEALQEIAGSEKVRVAAWVMTHDHGDHFGALLELYFANSKISETITVDEFWMNPITDEGLSYQAHLKNAFPKAKFRKLVYGQTITLDKMSIQVLCTPEVLPVDSRNDVNTNSLVMMITLGTKRILMTGDANEPAWDFMVRQQTLGEKYSLKCKYLQVPHHGVQAAGTAEGYAAADPDILIVPSTVDLANKLTTEANAKPSYDLYRSFGIPIGSLTGETNYSTYWFAGCLNKAGTKDIKCFLTHKGRV